MSSYREEKAQKERERARRAPKFIFEAAGLDRFDKRAHTPADGTLVVKTQPYGCPRNGTMGHCFIADAGTGEFIGLVSLASLRPI
jgi:hypothetical protein